MNQQQLKLNKYIESEFEGENKIKLRFIYSGCRIDTEEYKNKN